MALLTHPNVPVVFGYADHENGWGAAQNQALVMLAATAQAVAETVGANTPPGSPGMFNTYAVGGSPTGAWSGQAYSLAYWDGAAWQFIPGKEGWRVYNKATQLFHVLQSVGWRVDRPRLVPSRPAGASFTFDTSQAFGRVEPTNTGAITATIPAGVFAEGDEIEVFQRGGQITFNTSGAADLLLPDAKLAKSFGPNSPMALLFGYTDAGREKWYLFGDLAEE